MSGTADRRLVKDGLTIAKNDQIVLESSDSPFCFVVMDNDTVYQTIHFVSVNSTFSISIR